MKRILLAALFGFVLLFNSYALTTWYSPYKAAFSVDLKAAPNTYDGTDSGIYYDPNNPVANADYDQDTMVGTIGATDFGASRNGDYDDNGICDDYSYQTKSIAISFDFSTADNWVYVSQADPSLEVPFGLDIVIRYRVQYEVTGEWHYESTTRDYTYSASSENTNGVHQFGYQGGNASLYDGSREIIVDIASLDTHATEYRSEYNNNIGIDIGDHWTNYRLNAFVIGLWVDIVPVIPNPTENQSGRIGSANDYMASYTINVEGTGYLVTMTGYYDSPEPQYGDVLFSVSPDPNSYSLNISSLILEHQEIEIGTYNYTEEAITKIEENGKERPLTEDDKPKESPYYLFVSSSLDPTAPSDEFRMMHTDAVGSDLNGRNGFNFEVGLVSNGVSRFGTDNEYWYDGTATLTDSNNDNLLNSSYRFERMIGSDYSSTLYDDGKIYIRYKADDKVEVVNGDGVLNLVSGEYVSDIYIHLVSVV